MKKHIGYALGSLLVIAIGIASFTLISRTRAANSIGFTPASLRESVFGTDSKFSMYSFSPVPTDDVTFNFTTNHQCEVNTGTWQTSGTFTAFHGEAKKYVSVRAIDDNLIQGTHSCTISYTTNSTDSHYNGLSGSGSIAVTDNDAVPGLHYSQKPSSAHEGVLTEFAFHPNDDPTHPVYITTSISGPCYLRASVLTQKSFSESFYAGPPGVLNYYILPTDDTTYKTGQTCTVSQSAASSKDPNYNGKRIANFTVTIIDNDRAPSGAGTSDPSGAEARTEEEQGKKNLAPVSARQPAAKNLSSFMVNGKSLEMGGQATEPFAPNTPITFSGKTIPSGIVTLYIYSTPKQYVAHADAKGVWTYEAPGLPSGVHHAEVTVTDPATKQTSQRSQLLSFTVSTGNTSLASESITTRGKGLGNAWTIGLLLAAGAGLVAGILWRCRTLLLKGWKSIKQHRGKVSK